MKKNILTTIFLFLSVLTFAQTYTLTVNGYIGQGSSSCGSRKNGLAGIKMFYSDGTSEYLRDPAVYGMRCINQSYTHTKTLSVSKRVTRIQFHTISRRRSSLGDCKSSQEAWKTVNVGAPCFYRYYSNKEIYRDDISGNGATITITPNMSLSFVSGSSSVVKKACENQGIDIRATSGFTPTTDVYKWEFLDPVNKETETHPDYQVLINAEASAEAAFRNCVARFRDPDRCTRQEIEWEKARAELYGYSGPKTIEVMVWRPISNKTGQASISLRLTDLYSSAANRTTALTKTINIRVNPSCVSTYKTNTVGVSFLPESPQIARAPSVVQPTCSYSKDARFSLYFNRQLASGEKMNINLFRKLTHSNSFVAVSNRTNITSFRSSGGQWIYDWNPTANELEAGRYKISVTGFLSGSTETCAEYTYEFDIAAPSPVSYNVVKIQDETCFAGRNGSIKITPSGGSGSFQYSINNGSTWSSFFSGERTVSNMSPGTYVVKVRDSKGCNNPLIPSVSITISGKTKITHTVTSSDVTHPGAPGASDASIRVRAVSGGTPFTNYYNYRVLINGSTSNVRTGTAHTSGFTINGLPAGTHKIIYTDKNNCTQEYTLPIITNPSAVAFSVSSVAADCYLGNGRITISGLSGGYPNYKVTIKRGTTTVKEFTNASGSVSHNVSAGSYTVIVTDTRNGSLQRSTSVGQPAEVRISNVNITPIKCYGEKARVTISATGGKSGRYQYAIWNGSSTVWQNSNVFDLNASPSTGYRFRVRDINVTSCQSTISTVYRITTPQPLTVSNISVVHNNVYNGNAGRISLSISGGTTSYAVSWTKKYDAGFSRTGTTISGLRAGFYTATVRDANGCTVRTAEIEVTQLPELRLQMTITSTINCFQGSGGLRVTATGGSGNYNYTWYRNGSLLPNSGNSISNAIAGNYSVTVNDGYTSKNSAITLAQPSQVTLSLSKTDITCFNANNGTIKLNTSGGTGVYQYSIDNRNTYINTSTLTNNTITGLLKGTYTVWLRDSNGCEITSGRSVTLTEPAQIAMTATSIEHCSATGANTGSITMNASGGTTPYSYRWTKTGTSSFVRTTKDISGLYAGVYTLVVTDANGCRVQQNYEVKEPQPISVNIQQTKQLLCFGDSTAELLATVSGGYPIESTPSDFTYKWYSVNGASKTLINSDFTRDRIQNLPKGRYRVEVSDSKGETAFSEITIAEPTKLTVSIGAVKNVSCFNGADGEIQINVSGGTPNYTYKWHKVGDTGFVKTTKNPTNLTLGTYFVEVKDTNGCTITSTNAQITQPNAPISVNHVNIINLRGFETNDGSIEIAAIGGTPGYTYEWRENGTIAVIGTNRRIENLKASTYELTIKDVNNCVLKETYTVTQPTKLEVTQITQNGEILCFGDATVALVMSVQGGVAPYTYKWYAQGSTTPLSTLVNITNRGAGIYVAEVTDANGIKAQRVYTVTQPALLKFEVENIAHVKCFGEATGSISVTAIGGTAPYTYSWSNGEVGSSIASLVGGSYTVTIRDKNLCEISRTYKINTPAAPLAITLQEKKDATGFGLENGSIKVQVSGGTPSYIYTWKNELGQTLSSSTNELLNIGVGTYDLTVTDQGNCIVQAQYTIIQPPLLVASVEEEGILCNGEKGKLKALVNGGVAPYQYVWKNNSGGTISTSDLIEVVSEVYHLEVIDANDNRTQINNIQLSQPEVLEFNTTNVTNVFCYGANTGSIAVTVKGGVAPYVYSWRHGAIGSTLSNLEAGTYTVVVRDKNLCEITQTFEITQPQESLKITLIEKNNATGFGLTNGSIKIQATGGTPAYTYEWKDGSGQVLSSTSNSLNNIGAGTYEVTVKEQGDCFITATYEIEEPEELKVSVQEISIPCNGEKGQLRSVVTGGVAPYVYTWKNASGGVISSSQNIEVFAGVYSLKVTDANNNNTEIPTINLVEPPVLEFTSINITDVLCYGEATGGISVNVQGGTAPYTYVWRHGASEANLSSLEAGEYYITVRDKNFCEISQTVQIKSPAAPIAITLVEKKNATGFGLTNGSVEVTVSGGSPSYTYLWKNSSGQILSSTTNSLINVGADIYELTVTDQGNCIAQASYEIEQPAPLVATIQEVAILCNGEKGKLQAEVTGGVAPYSYIWKDNAGATIATTPSIETLAGTYSLEVTDANNNQTQVANIQLTQPDTLVFSAFQITDVLCYGGNTGAIELTISGGVAPYNYSWKHTSLNEGTLTNLTQGVYSVTVTDQNGCSITNDVIEVTEPELYEISETNLIRPSSDLVNDGRITIKIVGGVAPYQYRWTNQTGALIKEESTSLKNDEVNNLDEGTYTIRVTDANGCVSEETYNLANPGELLVDIEQLQEITCYNGTSGILDVITIGGAGGNKYTWYNATSNTIVGNQKQLVNIPAGIYYVVVDNADGIIEKSSNFEVKEPEEIKLIFTTENSKCFEANNGIITASITGGNAVYEYRYAKEGTSYSTWINAVNAEFELQDLIPGIYKIQIRDGYNCYALNTLGEDEFILEITEPELLEINLVSLQNLTGFELSNGGIEVAISGGTTPYTYNWQASNGITVPANLSITDLPVGTYTFSVKDAKGCTTLASYELTQPDKLEVSIEQTSIVSCKGSSDGSLKAIAQGGVINYTYTWFRMGETTVIGTAQSLTGINTGQYYVVVTDANNNEATSVTIEVTEPEELEISLQSEYVSCGTGNDWSIQTSVTGGTAPYAYLWSNGQDTAYLENVEAGYYAVTVVDANGCRIEQNIELIAPDAFTITTVQTSNPTGFGLSNGFIEVALSGATPPYTHTWKTSGGQVLPGGLRLENLPQGSYILEVEDSKGCQVSEIYELTQPDKLEVSLVHTSIISCKGSSDGAIKARVTGGVGGYAYAWYKYGEATLIGTASEVEGLDTGRYYVTVVDANGNTVTSLQYELTEPEQLELELVSDYVQCGTGNDWSITSTITGGTAPYTYLWNTGQTTASLENMVAGSYSLTVADINGCKIRKEITLVAPLNLEITTVSQENPTGFELSNGFIEVALSGGTPPYLYTWTNSEGIELPQTLHQENLPKGIYTLEVIDLKGCTTSQTYELTQPDKLEASITRTAIISCNGSSDGRLQVAATGGVPGYTFKWYQVGNNEVLGTTSVLNNLQAGTYYAVIEDTKGNMVETALFILTEPEVLTLELSADYVNCGLGAEWTVNTVVAGGTAPYTYLWNTGANSNILENVLADTYEVTVVDINGCRVTKTLSIQLPEPLDIFEDEAIDPTCYLGADGSIHVTVVGGTGPYSYNWSNGATTANLENLAAGTYEVIIKDSRGCTITESYVLTDPEKVYLDLGDDITLCKGQTAVLDGSVFDGVEYLWTSSNGFTSTNAVVEVTEAGTYYMKAIDSKGCEAIDEIVINRSNADIMSDFLTSTQVFVGESLVAANISTPKPDESTWILPSEAQKLDEGADYVEMVFDTAGVYEISLLTRIGDCEAFKTKTVFVVEREVEGESEISTANQPMIQDFIVYPNPSTGRFTLDVKLRKEKPLGVRIFGIYNNNLIHSRKVEGDSEYSLDYNLNLTSGVYIILIETENERLVKKIIVQ